MFPTDVTPEEAQLGFAVQVVQEADPYSLDVLAVVLTLDAQQRIIKAITPQPENAIEYYYQGLGKVGHAKPDWISLQTFHSIETLKILLSNPPLEGGVSNEAGT